MSSQIHLTCCGSSDQTHNQMPIHLIYMQNADSIKIGCYQTQSETLRNIHCTSWGTFAQKLSGLAPQSVEVPVEIFEQVAMSAAEFVSMLQSLYKLVHNRSAAFVGVVVNSETNFNTIKRLRSAGICGIVPSIDSYGAIEYSAAVNLLSQGQPYWPDHVINSLPGRGSTVVRSEPALTPRQQQVFELICHRGLSNKQIARALDLSESTVKIHVSSIMKTLGVRNRTQMALSGSTGLQA